MPLLLCLTILIYFGKYLIASNEKMYRVTFPLYRTLIQKDYQVCIADPNKGSFTLIEEEAM